MRADTYWTHDRVTRGGAWRLPRLAYIAPSIVWIAALVAALAACSTVGPPSPPAGSPGPLSQGSADWLRFGFDPARSGVNPIEAAISPSNVSRLHRLWLVTLPAVADSSPAFLHAVPLPGGATATSGATRDLLFLTTRDGRVLALDAGNGATVWAHQPGGPKITHSSPALDPNRQDVYAYGLDGALHRYRVATGAEVTGNGWPVPITRMRDSEKESSALNVADGHVYVVTSGYLGDAPPYQGHVVSVDATSGASAVFNSLCADVHHLLAASECQSEQSGIWARGGAVIDPQTGKIYVTTGNGPYTANQGGSDYGDSVLALSADGTRLLDSYTPTDFQRLDDGDTDLGSTAPALLPQIPNSKTPLLLVQGGKDAKLRLLNRQNLSGQAGPGHVGGEVQVLDSPCGVYTQPTVWTDPSGKSLWVFVAGACGLAGYQVATDGNGATRLRRVWQIDARGTSPVLAGGMLFVATDGAVLALDHRNGHALWSSAQSGAGGSIGGIHWESPIVVNGRIYITDEDSAVVAFGL
jgi:outer membrane protein assembly factor BamB